MGTSNHCVFDANEARPYNQGPVRNSSWRLRGARLLLCVFALFWGESFVLASCPMHEGRVEHASHGGHDSAPTDAPAGHCDCLGSCVSSSGLGLASKPVTLTPVAAVVSASPAWTVVTNMATVDQLHLPEAQGPPVSA